MTHVLAFFYNIYIVLRFRIGSFLSEVIEYFKFLIYKARTTTQPIFKSTVVMYDARLIANYFVWRSISDPYEMDLMKVLKLTYIAYGWYYGLNEKKLYENGIEAWKYGPVVPDVYHAFKHFRNNSINKTLMSFKPEVEDEYTKGFLDHIYDKYKKYNGIQLSELTHKENTPWSRTKQDVESLGLDLDTARGAIIKDDYIKEYYQSQLV